MLTLSTALTLCPNLLTLQQQSEREKKALQRLALLAYNFSPTVIVTEQGLWLELSGCEQLFHSYNQLLRKLQQALLSHSSALDADSIEMGFAESAEGARLLCRPGFYCELPSGEELLHQLHNMPISALNLSRRQQQSFRQLGLN